jgi:hypothetical protein
MNQLFFQHCVCPTKPFIAAYSSKPLVHGLLREKASRTANPRNGIEGLYDSIFSIRCLSDLITARELLEEAPLHLLHLRNKKFEVEGLLPFDRFRHP